jgi:hypothetical protein
MYVKLWDIKYLKFRTLKVHLVNETLSLIFVFHNIKYATLKIFHKVHTCIKNVDFHDFILRKSFKWFLTWWPQKQFQKT